MSSAEQNSPKDNQSNQNGAPDQKVLQSPPKRPTLVSPPKRPSSRSQAPTVGSQGEPDHVTELLTSEVEVEKAGQDKVTESTPTDDSSSSRYQPIAPPSEPMQYRAIGLVKGTYHPTETDKLNRGSLVTEDGSVIDSVLLGRVTSLVKKHIDLTAPHLWVVYPRTRRNDDGQDQDLHLQIVGVWEPETLGLPGEPAPVEDADGSSQGSEPEAEPTLVTAHKESGDTVELPSVSDNYFSIRGEVVKYSPEEEFIAVKILQGMRRAPGTSKPFKVNLKGTIEGRAVGYFWDFTVKRQDQLLVLEDASVVGIVPPKKRAKGRSGPPKVVRGGGKRPMPSRRSPSPGPREGNRPRKVDASKDLGA